MEHKNIKLSKFREGLLSWLSRHWKKISFRRFRSAAVFCCCSLLLLASAPAAFAGLLDIYKINATDTLNAIVTGFGAPGGVPDTIDKLASNDQQAWPGTPVTPNTRAEFGTFTKNAFESLKTDLVDNFFNALQGVNEKLGENGVEDNQFNEWKTSATNTLTAIESSFTDDTINKLSLNSGDDRKEFGVATRDAFESLKTDLVDNFFNALQGVNEKLGENGIEDDQLKTWKTNAEGTLNTIVTGFGAPGAPDDPIDKLGAADGGSYQMIEGAYAHPRTAFGVATRDAFGGLRSALVDNFFGAVDDVDNAITASLMKRVGVLEENFDTLMGPEEFSDDCCYGIIPEMKRDITGLREDLDALIPEIWDYIGAMGCKCDDRFNEMNDILTEVYNDVATLKSEFAGLQPIVLGPAGETDGTSALLNELRRDVTALEGKVDGNDGLVARVKVLEDDRDEAEEDIKALQTGLNTANTDIATLKTDVLNVKEVTITKGLLEMARQIGELQGKVDNTSTGLGATYAMAQNLQTVVNDTGNGLAAAHSRITDEITARQNKDNDLQDEINEANGKIATLQTDLGTANGKIEALEGIVNDDYTGLGAAHNKIDKEIIDRDEADTALQDDITKLYSRVATLEEIVGDEENGLVAGLNAANGRIEALEGTVNNEYTGLEAAHNKIDEANGNILNLQNTVNNPETGLVAKVGALEETVGDDYNGLVAGLNNEITNRQEADYDLQSEIAAFKTAVFGEGSEDPLAGDALITRVGALEETVGDDYNGLVADVAALQIDLSNEAQTREEADYDLQSEIAAFKTAVFGEGSEDPLAGDALISRFAALEGKVDDGYTGLEAAHKRIAELEEELDRLRGYLDLQIVGAGLAGAEYANYTGHVTSCLAGTVVNAAEVVQNCIDCRLCDVKGNGNDPFLQIFGGYGKRDKISDLGYDCATYGILLGEDFMKQLGDSAFLKLGGAVSFAHNNVKFSGNGAENGKKGEQNILFGNLFGAYEGFGEENLKTDINALIGFGYSRNKVRRTDASNSKFDGKFPSTDFNVSCELVKNFFHLGNAQVGPWMKVTYNHIAQKEYAESGDENNQENSKNLSMSKSRFNYLNTTLGINLEWEFSNAGDECEEQKLSDANNGEPAKQELNDIKDEERRLRLFAKFGWEYQPIRSRSGYAVTFDGSQFEPNFGNGNKHFFVAVCGFRYKLSTHFEISSNVAGRITSDDRYFNVNAGLGYSF